MSVILDALKKLDREKPYRGDGPSDITSEILKPDLRHPVKRIRVYFLIVALTVAATLAVTYAVIVEFGSPPKSSPSNAVTPPRSSEQIPPAPPDSRLRTESSPGAVSPPAESQQVVPAVVSREPAGDVRKSKKQRHLKTEAPGESRTPVETKTPVEIKPPAEPKPPPETPVKIEPPAELKAPAETKTPVISLEEKKTVVPEKTGAAPGSARKTVEAAPKVSPTTQPSLKVSAIVWYEDPSQRFAMINGIKATEGSEVDGVKVVEINPTGVRLLHNGRYFEISMAR